MTPEETINELRNKIRDNIEVTDEEYFDAIDKLRAMRLSAQTSAPPKKKTKNTVTWCDVSEL